MLLLNFSSDIQMIGRLICLILVFVLVLFLAYVAARITGSVQSNVVNKQSNMRVVEVMRISANNTIEIVKVGERYLALAVSKDRVVMLTELDPSEVREQEKTLEPINFKQILDKMKNERQNKK